MKQKRSAEFCTDRIGVITNFAVITNVVIKRVHCIPLLEEETAFMFAFYLNGIQP